MAELRRCHVGDQREVAERVLRELRGRGLETTIRRLVSLGVATHAVAPDFHRVLTEELPQRRSRTGAKSDPLLTKLDQFFEGMSLDVPDRALAVWMIDTVAYAVIHRAVVERPDDLSTGVLEKELVTLLLRYLRRR